MVNQLDYTEKINQFLLTGKETGLDPEKIRVYLNLLKFFVEHLAKKNLIVEKLDDPVSAVMQIKFEGLDMTTQQDYLQLFLDFTAFCKKLPQAERVEAVKKSGVVAEPINIFLPKSINCSKCGFLQKRSPSCIQCGNPLPEIFQKIPKRQLGAKENKQWHLILMLILVVVTVAALIYFLPFGKKEDLRKQSDTKINLLMNKDELRQYAKDMGSYCPDLRNIEKSWREINNSKNAWTNEHEDVLTNLTTLKDRIRAIAPPKELVAHNLKLMELSAQAINELANIKTEINSAGASSQGGARAGRAYNSVNVIMDNIEKEIKEIIQVIKDACDFNNVSCDI